jgi:hypothetical protein
VEFPSNPNHVRDIVSSAVPELYGTRIIEGIYLK